MSCAFGWNTEEAVTKNSSLISPIQRTARTFRVLYLPCHTYMIHTHTQITSITLTIRKFNVKY
jgi:hypothetical protein